MFVLCQYLYIIINFVLVFYYFTFMVFVNLRNEFNNELTSLLWN